TAPPSASTRSSPAPSSRTCRNTGTRTPSRSARGSSPRSAAASRRRSWARCCTCPRLWPPTRREHCCASTAVPESVHRQEPAELCERVAHDGVVGPSPALLAGQEACVDELLEMVADGGLADVEHVDQIAGAD